MSKEEGSDDINNLKAFDSDFAQVTKEIERLDSEIPKVHQLEKELEMTDA